MNGKAVGLAVAVALIGIPDIQAQYLDGQYQYYREGRAHEDASSANAWYGETNWYQETNHLEYLNAAPYPYYYSSNYQYGTGVPAPINYYGGPGTGLYGNWYGFDDYDPDDIFGKDSGSYDLF